MNLSKGRLALLLAIVTLFASCVPNRKYVYFQRDDLRGRPLVDTVVRSMDLTRFDYRIQPEDALFVKFESLTDSKFDFLRKENQNMGPMGTGNQALIVNSELVDPQGEIQFPVVGKVKVSGLTVFEAQDKLQVLANEFLSGVIVKVRIVNFRFTVLGEVKQEGTVVTVNNRTTLPEAIGLAGGLDELADRSRIKLIRQKDGQAQVVYLDLLDENLVSSPYYYMNQNDILIVPALRQRPYRKYFGPNFSIFISSVSVVLLVISISIANSGSTSK